MICKWVKKYITEGESPFAYKGPLGKSFAAFHASKNLSEAEQLRLMVAKLEIENERSNICQTHEHNNILRSMSREVTPTDNPIIEALSGIAARGETRGKSEGCAEAGRRHIVLRSVYTFRSVLSLSYGLHVFPAVSLLSHGPDYCHRGPGQTRSAHNVPLFHPYRPLSPSPLQCAGRPACASGG